MLHSKKEENEMSFRNSTDALRTSNDSDGPCLVLPAQDPLARHSLSSSLDSVITSVSTLLRTPSPTPAALPSMQLLPAAAVPLPVSIVTKPDCDSLLKRIDMVTPLPTFAQRFALCSQSMKFENRTKNRYDNVFPTDKHLVKVSTGTGYINANQFKDLIITQGPLKDTLEDFWVMLFEQKVSNLICLTNHVEQKEKTFPYWMPIKDQLLFESEVVQVMLIKIPEVVIHSLQGGNQSVRKQVFAITIKGNTVTVQHWHYINWMDHSACDPQILVALFEKLIAESVQTKCTVHCSAGLGRAGTFGVLYSAIMSYLKTRIAPQEVDISKEIVDLRHLRPGSVMYPNQLELIFDTLELFIKRNPAPPK